ncbi:MAG: MBL fold metallo-hydrolase, partial [Cyclobacteriaceae bacterium]|nr:MBL fold metallo-hydrolase [Cyclobacteriaceae bacterium]
YIKSGSLNILLDPMFGTYPSPFPYLTKRRFNDSLPLQIKDLPLIDVVVYSHDHYDHLDYGSILKLKDKVKKFLVPLGVGEHLRAWGVDGEKIIEMNWYESIEIKGTSFICTPAQHFSGRGFSDKMSTLWSSWVIKNKNSNLFFSGDSGYFDGFKEIGNKYGPFDICFMECGQYNELWKDIHMFPEETAQAHLDLQGKLLVPIHWGAFSLSVHDWNDPVKRLNKEAQIKGINVYTPEIGEPITFDKKQEEKEWWNFQ